MDCPGFRFEELLQVSAGRMFKAWVLEGHVLIPKIMPHIVSSASFVKGDGGPGSIRRFNYTDVLPFTLVDEHIQVVDVEKLELRFSMKETVRADGRVISASYLMQFQPCENNGSTAAVASICRTVAVYNTAAGGAEAKEEEIISGKEGLFEMFKNVEAYLIANPTSFV
ncbi:hypothetical protein ACLOJK_017734 [Asimina triloba]